MSQRVPDLDAQKKTLREQIEKIQKDIEREQREYRRERRLHKYYQQKRDAERQLDLLELGARPVSDEFVPEQQEKLSRFELLWAKLRQGFSK